MRVIGTLGGDYSSANAINDAGDIVGAAKTENSITVPFIRHAGIEALTNLGTLGGSYGTATSVSSNALVAGTSEMADGTSRAFVWSSSGGMINLGSLAVNGYSYGYGVNQLGQVAGTSQTGGADHAFLWTAKYGMIDLGSPYGGRSDAFAISPTGIVAGNSGFEKHLIIWVTRRQP
jgi:probable HAF family extracellular repeat protein